MEAITERQTISELAEKFDLDGNQISEWKKKFLSKAHLVFDLDETEENSTSQNNQ